MVLYSVAMRAYPSPRHVNDILLGLPLSGCGSMVPFIQILQLLSKLTFCLSCGASRPAVSAPTAAVAKEPLLGPQVAQAP